MEEQQRVLAVRETEVKTQQGQGLGSWLLWTREHGVAK